MIMVTGARGQLASLTLDELARSGGETVAGTRHPSKGERLVDFDDPATLDFSGISTLVLVSAGYAEDDSVVARHRAAIEAAERDGVKHVIYTSLTGAGDHLAFALAHRATEKILQASALEWTILRNGLYAELFGSLLTWTPAGLVSPFAHGAIAVAARPDLAIAAARVAASPKSHVGRVYELVAEPITAADVAEKLGVEILDISLSELRAGIETMEELLPFQPAMLFSIASTVRHGFMSGTSDDLASLVGRPATDVLTVAAAAAAAAAAAKPSA